MQLGKITLGLQAAQTASNTECRNLRYLTSFTVTGGERFIAFLNVFFLIFHVFNVFFGFVLERFSHLCLSLTRITPSITVHINGNRITLSPNPNQGYVRDGDFRGGGCPGGGKCPVRQIGDHHQWPLQWPGDHPSRFHRARRGHSELDTSVDCFREPASQTNWSRAATAAHISRTIRNRRASEILLVRLIRIVGVIL